MSLTVNRNILSLFFSLAGTLMVMLSSCSDERFYIESEKCPSGLPATVTVPISTTDMPQLTRADMQPGVDSEVSNLVVAIYNVNSRRRTGYVKIDDPDQPEKDHELKEITLNTLSGRSYIVAVANYKARYASLKNPEEGEDGKGNLTGLEAALDEADTWDKFCEISAAFDAQGNYSTEAPRNPLLMSGSYTEHAANVPGNMTEIEPVNIKPDESSLDGAIHLRRLISQVKFNVSYNKENIKSFRIKSWRVVNVPSHSWLLEHENNESVLAGENRTARNAIDVRTANGNSLHNTPSYTDMTTVDNTTSFDFWQLENKRDGRDVSSEKDYDSKNPYAFREKEYKNPDGSNSGKYMSLVESITSTSANNNASYVVISVSMEMAKNENNGDLDSDIRHRLVETDYIVHLGYVEGGKDLADEDLTEEELAEKNLAEKARDFRVRRNSKYTYNVKINNVADVLVEAQVENGEKNPGVEGFVSDLTSTFYQIDAHYSAVNVYLSNDELKDFNFYVNATRLDGSDIFFNSVEGVDKLPKENDDDDFMYMGWVEFRKLNTSNEENNPPATLAEYKPRSGRNSDGKTYTLTDIKTKGYNKEITAGWYTMFLNEYVYEKGDGDETGSSNWHGYVNRPDRRVWIYVDVEKSTDGNSIHYKSKYCISQSSIQTYYANNTSNKSGLGVEHVNESYGLNLRNAYNKTGKGNPDSGRYNLAYRLAGHVSWSDNEFNWRDDAYNWNSFLNMTNIQSVNKIDNQGVSRDARNEPLPEIKSVYSTTGLRPNNSTNGYDYDSSTLKYEADRTDNPKYIEAILACLNRNRDNDGDGKIDASEIRWFVPTKNQYIRVILGRGSLVDPLVDVNVSSKLDDSLNKFNSKLLFATSDGSQIWVMEGTSDSNWRGNNGATPWEVRCVRNLGGNQTQINKSNVTEPAFFRRPNENIIDLSRYEDNSIRKEAYIDSDYPMPVHHVYDQSYNKCYKAFEFLPNNNGTNYDVAKNDMNDQDQLIVNDKFQWSQYLSSHNPCQHLVNITGKDGWRVPNQKELTILASLGIYTDHKSGIGNYLSCSMSYYDKSGNSFSTTNNAFDYDSRNVMKVRTNDGVGTQGNEGSDNFGGYGVRCVRDYVE